MNKENWGALELLRWAVDTYQDRIALASSFGAEDMVLIDLLSQVTPKPRVFTLDTGRLPVETYEVMQEVERRYNLQLEVYCPDYRKVEEMVRQHGINLFYQSVENRKLCCHVRKVEPLQRALSNLSAWVSGLRRQQSAYRSEVPKVEEDNGRIKISPLADWSDERVWSYIRKNDLPYNKLHDRKYPSIGCAPCTRPVQPGEDPRAGRWWWENSHKECGLHEREELILVQ
ncbi:MAG: phosphoadenylyl-sulfate reductase [Acidobacteriota bacterium]